jgi:hypothetical protein
MNARPKRRPVRPCLPSYTPPRLVQLPALRPDADPRPALLASHPRAVPVVYPTIAAALDALRRLQCADAGGGRA